MPVRVLDRCFDPGAEADGFMAGRADAGAVVSFTGLVRSRAEDPILALEIECYVALAEAEIDRIVTRAIARFALIDALVVHRHGRLAPGEPIMAVMTLAPHRAEAFAAAQYLMDYLKTDAPFWKKELRADGARWVEPRAEDAAARARW